MYIKELLDKLKIGNGSSEDEKNIREYFLLTSAFEKVIYDDADIIEGYQGSGKSAIYGMISNDAKYFGKEKLFSNISILEAVNIDGHPIISLFNQVPNGFDYKYAWKLYFFIIISNWIIKKYKENKNDIFIKKLESWLNRYGLLNFDLDDESFIRYTVDKIRSFKKFELLTFKTEFDADKQNTDENNISPDIGLGYINDWIIRKDFYVWIILDRLDEAFDHNSKEGYLALRGLISAYQDLKHFNQMKLKLFIRDDVMEVISMPNFPIVQKIRSKMSRISWQESDLFAMICKRIRNANIFDGRYLDSTNQNVFYKVFPEKMNEKTDTWSWIVKHLSDSNEVLTPRSLIQFAKYAIEFQRDKESRENEKREYIENKPLIELEQVKLAYKQISRDRYEDTLLSSSSAYARIVKNFNGSKSTHNMYSLKSTINVDSNQYSEVVLFLKSIGFLKESKNFYIIPLLYRPALNITQGKAWEQKK